MDRGRVSADSTSRGSATLSGTLSVGSSPGMGLASALALSRDHYNTLSSRMGTGLSQSPAARPRSTPSASSRLFSLARSYLFKRKKQQQLSLLRKSIGEKVSLSPPLLFLGRCSFKLAVQKIKLPFSPHMHLFLFAGPGMLLWGGQGSYEHMNKLTPALQMYI